MTLTRINPGIAALALVVGLTAALLILQGVERKPITPAPEAAAPQVRAPGLSPAPTVVIPDNAIASVHAGDLPNPRLTPGLADPSLTQDVLCAPGFTTRTIRDVPLARKEAVYKLYGMGRTDAPCPCELDHLIPLELGGSNEQLNLWPQSLTTKPWNAHVKDRLESRLRAEACSGKTPLDTAQRDIASNWIAAFLARFGSIN